ncbi:PAS domain-containing protein [Cobetia sp. 1CM21F]|uniref:helix-turn-helix transcriptional regulator n=1 Tax=Cobetia sp. 1CM21F TaxID=2929163 RepID=UPI0020C0B23F|nr:PAS domain-containing protein [Cobetia sp. 1CM21F]MCK8067541.1 PAS domain-containing protein [Cobetia sp. 1CM21F]
MTSFDDDSLYEERVLQLLAGTVRAVGSVLADNAEIVLHDLRSPKYSIAEIVNAHVTGRKQGDSVLAGTRTDKAFINALEESQELVSYMLDYPTFSRDGNPLRSSTAFYHDRKGKAFAALCINVDNAGIKSAISVLQGLVGASVPKRDEPQRLSVSATEPARDNIEDLMRDIINTATALNPGNSRAETKKANLLAVQQMQEKGIFLIKGGVEKAAGALGVTRYTIYNYLDELKNADS